MALLCDDLLPLIRPNLVRNPDGTIPSPLTQAMDRLRCTPGFVGAKLPLVLVPNEYGYHDLPYEGGVVMIGVRHDRNDWSGGYPWIGHYISKGISIERPISNTGRHHAVESRTYASFAVERDIRHGSRVRIHSSDEQEIAQWAAVMYHYIRGYFPDVDLDSIYLSYMTPFGHQNWRQTWRGEAWHSSGEDKFVDYLRQLAGL